MNGLRALGIAGTGEREAPAGLNLRQEEMGEEDRFKSVLSRIAASVNGSAAPPDAEEGIASGPASTVPDGRLRPTEASAESPDGELADGTVNALLRMFPNRLEASQEHPGAASEPSIHPPVVAVASPINDEVAAPVAVLIDLPASAAPAVTEIGASDLLPHLTAAADNVPDAANNEPAEASGAGNDPFPAVVVGGFRPADFDRASPAAVAGEPPARHAELTALQGNHAPGEAEVAQHSTPPELPRVTVISREKHLAPAQHPDPVRFAIPPANPQPDTPVSQAKGETSAPDTPALPAKGEAVGPETPIVPAMEEAAGPNAPPRNDRFAQTEDLPSAPAEPRSRPQNQEGGPPRNVSTGIAPAVAAAAVASTKSLVPPPDDGAGANPDLTRRIVTQPELPRATVIAVEKPSAPAHPATPAPPDPRPEPLRSPLAGQAPVGAEAAARSLRPAPESLPPSPIVPASMPQLRERDERGQRPVGAIPAAAATATPSTENTVIPTSIAPGPGPDVLQRISGAVVEAAGSAALTPAAPAGTADHAAAPTRALTIRIDLHDHGAVHVRLALNGNALSLRMRADREEVAEQLRQDHLKLSETLSAAGYDTEIVAIEGRRSEVTPLPGSDPAPPVGIGADDAANADRDAGDESRRPTARQPQEPNQGFGENLLPHEQEDHETRNIAQRRAGALYV